MFLEGGLYGLTTRFGFKKEKFSRESIMVLSGAMDNEELTLMPVDGCEASSLYEENSQLPVFIFGDDDDYDDDEDDFDDDDDDFDDDDDDYDDDELEDDDDDDEDDDYDDDEDDDYDDDEEDVDYDDFDE
jgi:hypothetical protein